MIDARSTAIEFLHAYYHGNNDTARALLASDVTFEGPSVVFANAEEFLASSAHVADSVKRVEIRKALAGGDDVSVLYDVHLDHDVQKFSAAQWFEFRKGKIQAMRVLFDTAPFRQMQSQHGADEAAVDPICKMRVEKASAAATRVRDGQTYYFCAAGCAEAFDRRA